MIKVGVRGGNERRFYSLFIYPKLLSSAPQYCSTNTVHVKKKKFFFIDVELDLIGMTNYLHLLFTINPANIS